MNVPNDPEAPTLHGTGYIARGDPLPRIDGRSKVTGQARYAAEVPAPDLVHGVIVNSTIACGRITALHDAEARAVPGVLDVLWHGHRAGTPRLARYYQGGDVSPAVPLKSLVSAAIHYSGQPVALVLAESCEVARHAASLIEVEYEAAPHQTSLLQHLGRSHVPELDDDMKPGDPKGDADAAFAAAVVKLDAEFHAGVEHHNPLEPHASTVLYGAGGALTVHDKNQGSQACRQRLMRLFGLDADDLTVINTFVGGAFGSGLRPQFNVVLAVLAALHLQRNVRIVLTRQQMFTFGHRPELWQRVRLGVERDGTLVALVHEAVGETSRLDDYTEMVVNWSGQLYRCDQLRLDYRVVPLDHHTPIDMRAPGAVHGLHALEVAMDELASTLGMDPLALRLVNYAERAAAGDKPYSSKALRACYEQGAGRFGWSKRDPLPRSMRDGDELIGWGMATGQWHAVQMEARAHAVLHADGRLQVESAASDLGTGTFTVLAQIAAAAMGLPLQQVQVRIADSRLPQAPVAGDSCHVASVGSAVEGACEKLQKKLWKLARALPQSPLAGSRFADIEFVRGLLRLQHEPGKALALVEVMAAAGATTLEASFRLQPDQAEQGRYVSATHSAVFCEVRVDEAFGTVRVTRVVSAVAAGRIVNPLTARSQVVGGVVWGIGQALQEETVCDHRLGRFMTRDLSTYHFPVNADIHAIDVLFVEEDDRIVSRLGAKGVGEIGALGVAAAVANAIHHATGRRLRSLPMTPDKVMRPGDGWAAGDGAVGLYGTPAATGYMPDG